MGADSLSGGYGDNSGPFVRKNQFRDVLFKYGPKPVQVAFKTGDYRQQVIFIGGLSDGFLATEYLEPLAIAMDKEKWSLVQPLVIFIQWIWHFQLETRYCTLHAHKCCMLPSGPCYHSSASTLSILWFHYIEMQI